MAKPDLINRLTEREREVLRLWMERKTAKEIALELSITHHAVEKRLKMARTKLDVGSSLEAARMLAHEEGYELTVAHSPEVPLAPTPSDWKRPQFTKFGAFAMIMIVISTLAALIAPYSISETEASNQGAEIEISGRFDRVFAALDTDESGFLENPESPFVTVAFVDEKSQEEGKAVLGSAADPEQLTQFYSDADTDRDGRISFPEYSAWSESRWAELGVEIKTIIKLVPTPHS